MICKNTCAGSFLLSVLFILIALSVQAQENTDSIRKLEQRIQQLRQTQVSLQKSLDRILLKDITDKIQSMAYPQGASREEIVIHTGLILSYNETHEMANWVAHMILPRIETGNLSRSNDFRTDPQISTGSSERGDYFMKYKQEDGSYDYDGYGYDRGHLVPSADYRWSKTAMSATYFYSNISPQKPDFNRKCWVNLENFLRDYVIFQQASLIVYTGPALHASLPKVKRSVNQMSLPAHYYKIAWDTKNERCIAFVMAHKENDLPVENYAVSVDSVEALTGLDFFSSLPDAREEALENTCTPEPWFSGKQQNDSMPLTAEERPEKTYNSIQAKVFMGLKKKVEICGTVVSTHLSDKGNTFLNFDKAFPNQVFTATIWDDYTANFSYAAHRFLKNKKVCVKGKVHDFSGTPAIFLKNEHQVRILE